MPDGIARVFTSPLCLNRPKKWNNSYKELQAENRLLLERCESLEAAQVPLEQIIGDGNAKLLHSEMISMELEQVFSAVTDALWVIREGGIVVRANEAMLKFLGKTMDEVVGKKCSTLLDHDLCRQPSCSGSRLSGQSTQEYDIQLPGPKGETNHYILTTAPLITLDGTPGLVGQFKNISERKRAEEQLKMANLALERLARVDGLTQVANRRCFDETLDKEWLRLSRDQKPLSLLLGDIDYFKKFNDHYGHQAGDDCLRQIGQTLAKTIMRPADLAARYGGEEFALILPEVDLPGAVHVGKRVLAAVTELVIKHQKSTASACVSMSMGAATLIPAKDSSPSDLVFLADTALYQAKASGRNRVVPASDLPGVSGDSLPTAP